LFVLLSALQERLDQPFFVWGEDALLKWPGAVTPLIEERDAYMARVVAAAAQGSNPNVPAYVADQVCCCAVAGLWKRAAALAAGFCLCHPAQLLVAAQLEAATVAAH
jgi:hypothetical protein